MVEPHPLSSVTDGFPNWVKWILHGIVVGTPLDSDEVRRHVIDDDPAPRLPDVTEPADVAPVTLAQLRLGPGCYGLAEGTIVEFGSRLTLMYGENGAGKSSLARVLRAIAGRPSTLRPPQNAFTGASGEATIRVERDGDIEEHRWSVGRTGAPPLHIEVFDSADTRVDGTEYQVRPRGVVALEDLRRELDAMTIDVDPLVLPDNLREVLIGDDLRLLEDCTAGVRTLSAWTEDVARPVTEVERELAGLADETLADRHAKIELDGKLARADVLLTGAVEAADLPALVRRLALVDLLDAPPPTGVGTDTWLKFLACALPLFEISSSRCVLCAGDVADRHAVLTRSYRAALDGSRATAVRAADVACADLRAAMLTYEGATGGGTTAVRLLAQEALDALTARDVGGLSASQERIEAVAAAARQRLDDARTAWSASKRRLCEAEERRAALHAELAVARRHAVLDAAPQAVVELGAVLRRRERLAAAARSQGTKQRVTAALRRHTDALLDSVYGPAFTARLQSFRVPHVDRLTARSAARGGRAHRHHVIDKVATGNLLSEGEQRALALADFAAELDTRPRVTHPVVIDDPVSSLDYRRLEDVVEYVRDLLAQRRQVIVLTHSVWLAAELLKDVRRGRDGNGPDRAWTLVRTEGRLGTVARLDTTVLGDVERLAERIDETIDRARSETSPRVRHELVAHGCGLLRAWCESFIEQKVLRGVVARLDWQVRLSRLGGVDQAALDRGRAVLRVYNRLHQRIDAHAQPGELMHRPDGLDDLTELWAQARSV